MFYMPAFVLGMGYAVMFQDKLADLFHWEDAWIAVMIAWGALLGAIAWTRHRRSVRARTTQDEA